MTIAQDEMLGCMIINHEAAINVYSEINENFFSGNNRFVYTTISRILERGQKPSRNVVVEYLPSVIGPTEAKTAFDASGGVDLYVENLVCSHDPSTGWKDKLELLKLEYAKRLLNHAADDFKVIANSNYDIGTMNDQARMTLSVALSEVESNVLEYSSKECVDSFLDRKKNAKLFKKVPFFFDAYNKRTSGGMLPGQIAVLGARSGVGKTMLACQQLETACSAGMSVDYYTMEMTEYEITERLVGIGGHSEATLNDDNFKASAIQKRAAQIRDWNFTVYEGRTNTSRIRTNLIRKITSGKKPDLIIIDHMHLMDVGGSNNYRIGLNTAVSEIKEICNTYKIPCMMLVQLRRPALEFENKPPIMSDIRESTAIEQIADYVLLFHRGVTDKGELNMSGSIYNPKRRQGKQFPTIGCFFSENKCKFVESTH